VNQTFENPAFAGKVAAAEYRYGYGLGTQPHGTNQNQPPIGAVDGIGHHAAAGGCADASLDATTPAAHAKTIAKRRISALPEPS
jgi:hypothetical protein